MLKFKVSSENWGTLCAFWSASTSQNLTDFCVEIEVAINEYFYINNEIWQCKIFITQHTNIFPMTKAENSFVDFNATECKSI